MLAHLVAARDRLAAMADADASAVATWMRTRRLPASDPARQAALQAIVDGPLEAAELCLATWIEVQPLLEHGYPPALPDGQVGLQLLATCRRALCTPVQANLPAEIASATLNKATETRLERLSKSATLV